jgi:transposase
VSGDLSIRTFQTTSGAKAVQVVRYERGERVIVKHIGSAHDRDELGLLHQQADEFIRLHCAQPDLFAEAPSVESMPINRSRLIGVTHSVARQALMACASRCGLGALPALYLDLALMRIIEPTSKLRSIELMGRYFDVHYSERTVYRLLPKLVAHQAEIEAAALRVVESDLKESLSLVLYDVTTLYFESFKDYEFQKPGFSKDNKPQQPQIVIGLITTRSGFPLMHEVFAGNTFEGNTMMAMVARLKDRIGDAKPIIVADAAMLSKANLKALAALGHRYIVGARLANAPRTLINQIDQKMKRTDLAIARIERIDKDPGRSLICQYSEKRYKKDKREWQKQTQRARELVAKQEPGRRAKFVMKSNDAKAPFQFDTEREATAERLLGIKGYVTNLTEAEQSSEHVIAHYHDLWHVEQAFRMTKSDLATRPIFHRNKDAILAHVLICFMALMMGKYLEIKTKTSLRRIRDALWAIQDATIEDTLTGKRHLLRMDTAPLAKLGLADLINIKGPH